MRGGKRAGAGRPPSATTKRALELAHDPQAPKRISAVGIMEAAMHHWFDTAAGSSKPKRGEALMRAAAIAKDVARYRTAPIQSKPEPRDDGKADMAEPMSDREIARRIAWILMRGADEPE